MSLPSEPHLAPDPTSEASSAPLVPHDRFLVFSLGRSGSTTLCRALDAHPEIRCLNEPFNPDIPGRDYHATVNAGGSLQACVERVFQEHEGFKHVWHPDGWPFIEDPARNDAILTCAPRVVFLYRKNRLRRIVSSLIGEQTEVYHLWNPRDRERTLTCELQPLDLEVIEWHLRHEQEALEQKLCLLEQQQIEHFVLTYEELYPSPFDLGRVVARLNDVLRFLGRPAYAPGDVAELAPLLDPGQSKVNSRFTYLRVPNVQVIEDRFGSHETGWLLR